MTDLPERLRHNSRSTSYRPGVDDLMLEAADALEQAEAQLTLAIDSRQNCLDQAQPLHDELTRLREALQGIKDNCGGVCENFEFCEHRACQQSYEAWARADYALTQENPE